MPKYRDVSYEPAFPIDDPNDRITFRGMSVRCWLSAQAMRALIQSGNTQEIGKRSVEIAQSVLDALHIQEDEDKKNMAPPIPQQPLRIVGPEESQGAEDAPEDIKVDE